MRESDESGEGLHFTSLMDEAFYFLAENSSDSEDAVSDTSSLSDITCGEVEYATSDMESLESSGEETLENVVGNEIKRWGQKFQNRSGVPVV